MKSFNRMRAVDIGVPILLLAASAFSASGQTGSATALYVNTVTVSKTVASASVPSGGGMGSADESAVNAIAVTASSATALATGLADDEKAGVQSIATLGDVVVLDGKVKVKHVIAVASSTRESSSDDGSGLTGLEVNGVAYDGDALTPGTRIDIPGGYVVIKERVVGASSVTVNMIHVVLTGVLGDKIGEIILGSATSDCGS